ncbi:MAG: hypothetical protein KDC18_06015 [Alphaproteobacteria bacterium]|nr:hypothetical protein [Alphaproteobacteria bacterium]MCB9931429.1 hypothetical protein [Alphaproteobacteria bacterium]
MTINQFRGLLYRIAKYSGDMQALTSKRPGAVQRRIWRRILGKLLGRAWR